MSSSLLVHFNPILKLTLACDVSAYGIAERPIVYASRSLSKAQQNYN